MEFRFSKDKNGNIVDVRGIRDSNRHELAPYTCLGCSAEMIPALGAKNAHHFRHKAETSTCGRETYLHQAAKMAVAEAFQQAKLEKLPYSLRIEHTYACPISTRVAGIDCSRQQDQDLTTWYQDAVVEAGIKGFVADVLLTSTKAPPLLVEIEVTHACEEEKVSSGLRIVEIQVQCEEDVVALRHGIDTTVPNVRVHGLSPKPLSGSCTGSCFAQARTFILFKSGKTWMGMKSFSELQKQSQAKSVDHIEVIEDDWEEEDLTIFDIDPHVRRTAFELKKNVKSCLLCRHHAFSSGRAGGQQPIWCFERREDFAHNEAAQCPSFSRITQPEALEAKREKLAQKSGRSRDQWMIDKMFPALRR